MQMILSMVNPYHVKANYITGESMLKILLRVLCVMSDLALKKLFTYYYLEICQTKNNSMIFRGLLAKYRTLPTTFVRDIIMKAPVSI